MSYQALWLPSLLVYLAIFCSKSVLCNIGLSNTTTAESASEYAVNELNRRGINNIEDRLAVIILQSSLHELESKETIVRSQLLRCVHLLSHHVADTTPLVTYVFTRSTSDQVKENFKTNFTDVLPNVNLMLMYIDDSDWTLPIGRARNKTLWHGASSFGEGYRLMGTWRLYFPFLFSKFVGHKYMLFLDSDSYFREKVHYNFVETMNEQASRKLGYIRLVADSGPTTRGLPELAKYFIVSRKFEPTQLYQDCIPQSIEGLFSNTTSGPLPSDYLGWHRTCVYGNFALYRTDYWFEPIVQEFLELVLYTQDQIVIRWNEQSVLGIIRLMFVRPEEEFHFQIPGYCHKC